jgi:hypothetical protein
VNNTLHPYAWYNDSDDSFRNNIVFTPYRPLKMREWTEVIDFNLLHQPAMPQTSSATALQNLSSRDAHSLQGDALFVDEATGDYTGIQWKAHQGIEGPLAGSPQKNVVRKAASVTILRFQ